MTARNWGTGLNFVTAENSLHITYNRKMVHIDESTETVLRHETGWNWVTVRKCLELKNWRKLVITDEQNGTV